MSVLSSSAAVSSANGWASFASDGNTGLLSVLELLVIIRHHRFCALLLMVASRKQVSKLDKV